MKGMLEVEVASSREDAWIETMRLAMQSAELKSRPPARTRGLKHHIGFLFDRMNVASSREDAWIETYFPTASMRFLQVASSREDAWIETAQKPRLYLRLPVASSREDAWIETLPLRSITP